MTSLVSVTVCTSVIVFACVVPNPKANTSMIPIAAIMPIVLIDFFTVFDLLFVNEIFTIFSSWGITLNRHQCVALAYMLHGVRNLYCGIVYSHIFDILHRSCSSLYCFQSVLSSSYLFSPFLSQININFLFQF